MPERDVLPADDESLPEFDDPPVANGFEPLVVCVAGPEPEFHEPPSPPVLAGSDAAALMVCAPSTPEPTVTQLPMLGTPLLGDTTKVRRVQVKRSWHCAYTTTKMRQGPGAMMAALGGACETCRVADPFE